MNRFRFLDPNDDDKEDWPIYGKQGDKVMVFGHGGHDYGWKLEADPMDADNVAKCDRLVSGMVQDVPDYSLLTQSPRGHLEMV